MSKQDERVRFMAKLPPDLHRWLKVAAAQQGVDMNDLIVSALEAKRGLPPGMPLNVEVKK